MIRLDLNADVGEGFGQYRLGSDPEILQYVTSANIACGLHAGDPAVMRRTILAAKERKVRIGAHPGYPDLQGFGRREMGLTPEEVRDVVLYQIGALQAFARACGVRLQHVKAHGALYNAAARDRAVAQAVAEAVAEADADLILVGLAGSALLEAGRAMGLTVAGEAFADRAYTEEGALLSRRLPGAVITDPGEAAARAVQIARGKVRTVSGREIAIRAETLCIHGDTPSVPEMARRIREGLTVAGIRISPLEEVLGR